MNVAVKKLNSVQQLLTDQWVESRGSLSLQSSLVYYFLPLLSPMILLFSHVTFFYFHNISSLKIYEEIQFIVQIQFDCTKYTSQEM